MGSTSVVNLKKAAEASKGKTLFHIGDILRYFDSMAGQQGSGSLRPIENNNASSQQTNY
jgi:hypothetical protein